MSCTNVPELFGSLVFNDAVMRERLPADVYKSLHKTIEDGKELDMDLANAVAAAMKDWAIEKGATHFTHWFQPMTGITAEKHDSFISPVPGGRVIMEFSGKELVKGEPDASSFPSGGIRATFEARGYTAWDPTSYAFIKDDSLCIPTAFCAYTGECLDKKTPLLRSMEEISKQAKRVLALLGAPAKRVNVTVGAEQEYFLIDKERYRQRRDLVITGRTLYGAKPPKGQEMGDHYFGVIRPRVMRFMEDLNQELWKVGVLAKTEHNEAAPSQHELAPVFTTANAATDQNQLTMEIMKKVADRHGLACLLHEKPFAGVNGSGKHNNWSLATDAGKNLFDPGKHPAGNVTFLLFLAAVLKAVDDYQDLLRMCVASAGNDCRLGGGEAPPAVISVFLGDDVTRLVRAVIDEDDCADPERIAMETGVDVLPNFMKDTTDRNRTSPFAFTGNKFEFRMPGSAFSLAGPNIILNTIVAESLSLFADELETAGNAQDSARAIARREFRDHERIIFNGNGYDPAWLDEAKKRGLLNLRTTADALPCYVAEKNVRLFEKHHIFTPVEVRSRYEIKLDTYVKKIHIEALTMLDMARKELLPGAVAYANELGAGAAVQASLGRDLSRSAGHQLARKLWDRIDIMYERIDALERAAEESQNVPEGIEQAYFARDSVLPAMDALREIADAIEADMSERYLSYPTYAKLLFDLK